jgi:hypothetical protein
MRLLAAGAVLVGLGLGSLGDRSSARPPLQDGGNWVLAADLHVHAFFGDVGLAPWDLQAEARRRGLDVLAVTNHRGTFGARVQRWWAARTGGPLILSGQEITTNTYHLIGAGIERTIEPSPDLASAIRAVHAQGGVAIAAHPNQEFWPVYTPDVLRSIDGLEVLSRPERGVPYERADITRFSERARREQPRVAFIGASDFHVVRPLGAGRTYVIARAYTRAGVLEAIRLGMTVAADIEGNLVGRPELVAYVEGVLARRPPDSGASGSGYAVRQAGFAVAWLGLVVLVLADRPRGEAQADNGGIDRTPGT